MLNIRNRIIANSKQFEIFLNSDKFKVTISETEESISFHAIKINRIEDIFYENNYKYDTLISLDRSLRVFDTISEIYGAIIEFFNQEKVKIKEIEENRLILEIKLTSLTGKDINITIELN